MPKPVPLYNAHEKQAVIGRWLRMHEDGYGLFVIGELNEDLPPLTNPYPGLSIGPVRSVGSPLPNVYGGKLVRWTALEEISLVLVPAHPGARVYGPW
jgi:phage head maturation protease